MTADVVISIGIDSSEAKAGRDAITRYLDEIAKGMESALKGDRIYSTAGTFSSLNDALHKTADSTKRTADAAAAYTTNLARLDYSLGLITRADLEYAEAEARITAALRSNIITADEAATRYAALNAKMDAGALGANKAGFAFGGMQNVMRQAGYQIADIATVSSMGGASLGMLGIQVGQLVGAFGAYGAAAGAAITVGGVLADMLIKSGDTAKTAAEGQKEYNKALDDGQAIVDRYAKALDQITNRPETWRSDLNALTTMQAQLDGLIIKRQQMDKDSAFFRTTNPLGLAPSLAEKKEVDNQIDQLRYAIQLAKDAQKNEPAANLNKAVGDSADARTRELALVRLSTSGYEREAAMLRAEYETRDKLKKLRADDDTLQREVEAARQNAAAIYDMEKAHKDATKAAAESERQQQKNNREMEQAANRRSEALASVEDEIRALQDQRFAMGLTERDAAIYRAGIESENKLRKAGVDIKSEEAQAAIRAKQAAAGATYDKQKETDRNKPLTEEQLRSMASSFSPGVQYDLQISNIQKYKSELIAIGVTEEQIANEIELANIKKLQSSRDWTDGATGALMSYANAAKNYGSLTARATTSSLNAMENALVSFSMQTATASQAFKTMAASIISDLVRMQIQANITGPLSSGLSGLFSNLFGGGGVSYSPNWNSSVGAGASYDPQLLATTTPLADGGVMTKWGKVPLRTYSDGGIANSPQAAIFGEGSVPEAYVPVPSGKIPVEMRGPSLSPRAEQGGGGGGQINQTNHLTIVQQPGEDGEALMARARAEFIPLLAQTHRAAVKDAVSAVPAAARSPAYAKALRGTY